MSDDLPVFAHSMWRTGSTFLASRFASSERYMLFYEPFHEYIGAPRTIARAHAVQEDKLAALRHPSIGGGYFDSYLQRDPLTGIPLWRLYPQSASLRDTYNAPSPRTIAYLEACARVARAAGQVAFFGFCASGTQATELHRRMPGTHLHLWRRPREQFRSYDWPNNDYFMPGTVVQLLLSHRLRPLAIEIGGRRLRAAALVLERVADRAYPARYRIGRWLCRQLSVERLYALFYLSWQASRRSIRVAPELDFSLSDLAADERLAGRFKARFGIDFAALQATPTAQRSDINFEAIEARVLDRLTQLAPARIAHVATGDQVVLENPV